MLYFGKWGVTNLRFERVKHVLFSFITMQCIFGLMRPKWKIFCAVSYIRIVKTTGYMFKFRTFYYVARNNEWCVFTKICNEGIVPNVYVVNGAIVNKCETQNTARWRIFWRIGHICILKNIVDLMLAQKYDDHWDIFLTLFNLDWITAPAHYNGSIIVSFFFKWRDKPQMTSESCLKR